MPEYYKVDGAGHLELLASDWACDAYVEHWNLGKVFDMRIKGQYRLYQTVICYPLDDNKITLIWCK